VDKANPAPGAAPFGLAWFLASLGVLFAAGIVGYLAVRVPAVDWGSGLPPLPSGLYLSTVVLVASSLTLHVALRGVRRGRQDLLRGGMAATTVLGVAFLALQVYCWQALYERAGAPALRTLYGMTFYTLTMLHAAHVVCGVFPLVWTTAKAYAGSYTEEAHEGVLLCAMYWHFLDVVWLILFVLLVVIA
jgi:cytochrome c oxidase subunit 3